MSLIGITTICHPPCIKYLDQHLRSIQDAIDFSNQKDIKISLVCSSVSKEEDKEQINKIVNNLPMQNVELFITNKQLRIPQARNKALEALESDWVVFTDADTALSKDYISELCGYLQTFDLEKTSALCGLPGILETSQFGKYTAIGEIDIVLRRVEGGRKESFNIIANLTEENVVDVVNNLPKKLDHLAGNKCRILQGYNHVIKRSSLQDRAYNEALGSAEDREMSLYLRLSRGEKIKFAPRCQIKHSFNFTRDQIIARHTVHGMWNRTVFGMYHPGRKDELPEKHEKDKIFTTNFFQTAAGTDYTAFSNTAYMTGRAYSGNPRYADHRILIAQGGINTLMKAERAP